MGRKRETQLLLGAFGLLATFGIVAIALVIFRLEKDEVFVLALIVVSGFTLAGIIAALALVFRARRSPTPPIEKHVIHTRERVLDGRYPSRPQIVPLPGAGNALPAGLYPHLLRGAYQAGQRDGADVDAGQDEMTVAWQGQIVDVEPE
jgi:amino acid transporter